MMLCCISGVRMEWKMIKTFSYGQEQEKRDVMLVASRDRLREESCVHSRDLSRPRSRHDCTTCFLASTHFSVTSFMFQIRKICHTVAPDGRRSLSCII